MKKRLLLILVVIGVLFFTSDYIFSLLGGFRRVNFVSEISELKQKNESSDKHVLIVHLEKALGGAEVHDIALYKNLIHRGYNVDLLIAEGSGMAQECARQSVPYIASNLLNYNLFKAFYKRLLAPQIQELCGHDKCLVTVYTERELWAAKKAADSLPIKIVMTRHIPIPFKHPENLARIDGVIGVSNHIAKYVEMLNSKCGLGIKNIETITPLFEEERFFSFKPDSDKNKFFKKEFGVELKDLPVVCQVGIMTGDDRKNFMQVLKVAAKLINNAKRPIEVVFAGPNGSGKRRLEIMAKELGIEPYVHVLGFTRKVSEVLYHSDIHVLPSKQEGCPISLLEAAIMKKPQISSDGHGGELNVIHGKTGLLCKNGDENDLLDKLGQLLDNPEKALEYGENAYVHVKENLTREPVMNKIMSFYSKILD